MTKTTTTCTECGKNLLELRPMTPVLLTEWVPDPPNTIKSQAHTFCSRSCLAEYLKPKTETTP